MVHGHCGIVQKDIPGIAQCLSLEEATILTKNDIVLAAEELMEAEAIGAVVTQMIPPRFLLNI